MALAELHYGDGLAPGRIHRPRLAGRFVPGLAPITVVVGPAGSGKSDLLRGLFGAGEAILFRAGNERRRLARFVHGFAQAIAPVAPGAHASFAQAWERSLQSPSPPTALARWLCEHLDGIDWSIAIDDLHDAAADPSIAAFIARFAEFRPHLPLTVAVRAVGALPIATWMASGQMQCPIDENDLNFNADEVAEAAERCGVRLPTDTLRELLAATSGLPIAVTYALSRLRFDPRAFAATAFPATFQAIAASVFARRTEHERDFLLSAALLDSIEDDALRLLGWPHPRETRAAMGGDTAFIWEENGAGQIVFHDRFRDYLEEEFQSRDTAFRSTIAGQTMASLSHAGRHAAALQVATRQPMLKAIGELLDAHGFEILESGDVDIISEALGVLEESSLGATGLALRGYLEARSGHLDTAEAWFRLSLDNALDETSRVTVAMYYARELGMRRREDACEVLEAFAASTTLPRPILIDVLSAFGRALTETNRLNEAFAHTERALALLDPTSPPPLRARVFARAAFVAFTCRQLALAREQALIAAPLAVAHSLYEVAGSAYSTLYNLAYDIDDDALTAMEYLRRLREIGAKSGTLRTNLYALFGMYELHAEAGDEQALANINSQLTTLDQHDATAYLIEVMVPSNALRASWAGHFDDAQRLLRPIAERQKTAIRRALCWAQVGLYCAAAADANGAREALTAAQRGLDTIEQHDVRSTQYGLTLLIVALASLVGDDVEQARAWIGLANDAVIGHAVRLCALRAAIEAMIAGYGDPARFVRDVPRTLAALRAKSFGGMANLIEALPYRFGRAAGSSATVGGVLADSELSGQFAAAVAADDTASLRAWLDTAHRSTFEVTPLTARFTRWVAANEGPNTTLQTRHVLRDLEAYQRPAAAIVRHIDEVDAALEELFAHLDVSSPLMAEHSRAVAAWCSRLGRTLGLAESEITFVTRCGLIHDIGKMGTPVEILEAPRKLTPEEWTIMRAHTTDGALIVERVPLLRPFIPIVRGHHERLDGKGYPDGLHAPEIPLAARIVAVADCFNAMIGRRPYRPAMPPTEALTELERHRGTQFDPEIVEAMVQIVLGRQPRLL